MGVPEDRAICTRPLGGRFGQTIVDYSVRPIGVHGIPMEGSSGVLSGRAAIRKLGTECGNNHA
jgi:hypothetical protein